jgi:hypothetical protein
MNFKNLDDTGIFDDFLLQYGSHINLNVQLNGYSSNYKGNTGIFETLKNWNDPNYIYLDNTPYMNWVFAAFPLEIVRSVNCCKKCCFTKDEEFALIAHEIGHIDAVYRKLALSKIDEELYADAYAVNLGLAKDLKAALSKMISANVNPPFNGEMNMRIQRLP